MTRRDAQAGFTLVELMISLLLTLLALGLAAQVLMESAQVLADTAAEQSDAPVPLALARIRGDVQSSHSYSVLPGGRLMLFGHPAGTLVYEQSGSELVRTVLDPHGSALGSTPVMRRVTDWSCLAVTSRLVSVTFHYRRHAPRRSPLPTVIGGGGQRGPTSEERMESILLALRGGGLGVGW